MKTMRRLILRANALYIGLAGAAGVLFDLRGIYFGTGPQGRILADAPHAGIGFVEAHGLAVILAVVLWRAVSARSSHLIAMAVDVLLGTANLLLWQIFVAGDALAVGTSAQSYIGRLRRSSFSRYCRHEESIAFQM